MKRFSYNCIFALILFFSFSKSSAQSNIIGNPIKIGNIEVAQYDFPDDMDWDEANRKCLNLREGWRLPTKDELSILYNNKNQIGDFNHPHHAYWSSTEYETKKSPSSLNNWRTDEIENVNAWRIGLRYGDIDKYEKFNKCCVRAVRTVSDIERRAEAYLNTNSAIINDIEVEKLDFPNRMTWEEAKTACSKLGHRWRLPNRDELKLLYQNSEKIGGLKINSDQFYWGIDESYGIRPYAQCMQDGGGVDGNVKWYLNVRAVRNIIKYDDSDAGKEVRKATIPFPRGGKYVGEVKNGTMDGYGTLTYSKNEEYVGEWKDDKRNGQGTMSVEGSWKYIGEWKNDSFDGKGTYTFSKGGEYIGEFKNNNFNGQGVMSYQDGRKYAGEWKEDKWNGQGSLTYSDGRKYVGEFKDGIRNGKGTLTYSDGAKYVGEFKEDKQNGQGTYTFNDGKVQKGIYENDVYIGEKRATVVQNNQSDNITESSDCSDIVNAYELAVRKNITALRKINKNAFVSQNELISLDNDIRKWQEIVMKKCAFDLKYANRVVNITEQLELGYNSTFPSIKENSVSNTNNNSKNSSNSSSSSSNYKQSSNSIKSGENKNQPIKITKKEVDLSYEVLSQIVSCKSCGSSVTVKINVPRSDEFKKSFNQIGGLTSSMCNKCHKTSSFNYEMKSGKFVKIN
jgi:hypothetical protein